MKRRVLSLLFCVFAAAGAIASPLTASWIDGIVERKTGSTWKTVSIGDKLDSADIVRLGKGALAEFEDGKARIALSESGTYDLAAISRSAADQAKKRSALLGIIGRIVRTDGPVNSATMGVRGASAIPNEVTWASEDADSLLAEAETYMRDARYADAAEKYTEAVEEATAEQRAEALFGQASARIASGEIISALSALRTLKTESQLSGSPALLLARLDIDSGAYAEARSVLKEAMDGKRLPEDLVPLAQSMLEEVAGK